MYILLSFYPDSVLERNLGPQRRNLDPHAGLHAMPQSPLPAAECSRERPMPRFSAPGLQESGGCQAARGDTEGRLQILTQMHSDGHPMYRYQCAMKIYKHFWVNIDRDCGPT